MQLEEINKARYRKCLNRVIVACIIVLVVGSLSISQLLIMLFPNESGSHFFWNLLGVVLTCICIGWVLNKYRTHQAMTEVVYVWELKQTLNRINRKMPKLKAAANEGNIDALQTIHFCYAGSRQLWQLDDNTITMDELAIQQAELDSLAKQFNVELNSKDFKEEVLAQF
ncbi:DUF3087 domain-containing protein [Aliiglaciecola lipolytica]|uniref:DUF3087 domain-containing protein n=1 Tax=Aliiglaciecola lipolytica E3 TaxID=1127673 RepID=K6X3M3_9ALTE|nr:DUF3087 domain-containing protein [Aliiglaciecola lipolytica]GAC15244.1 hypothetical protein GLIP_2619 [Aliiglaciecola lipolytica E3]